MIESAAADAPDGANDHELALRLIITWLDDIAAGGEPGKLQTVLDDTCRRNAPSSGLYGTSGGRQHRLRRQQGQDRHPPAGAAVLENLADTEESFALTAADLETAVLVADPDRRLAQYPMVMTKEGLWPPTTTSPAQPFLDVIREPAPSKIWGFASGAISASSSAGAQLTGGGEHLEHIELIVESGAGDPLHVTAPGTVSATSGTRSTHPGCFLRSNRNLREASRKHYCKGMSGVRRTGYPVVPRRDDAG